MARYTVKQCRNLAERVNSLREKTKEDDGYIYVDCAYGGYAVYSKHGNGVSDFSGCGHAPAKEIYRFLWGVLQTLWALENEKQRDKKGDFQAELKELMERHDLSIHTHHYCGHFLFYQKGKLEMVIENGESFDHTDL